MASKISLGFSGIIFWWVAARFYSIDDIGLASALISVVSLLIFVASLGLAPTFVRFLPQNEDRSKLLGTFLGFSLSLLIFLSLSLLIGIDFFLPKLSLLKVSFYPLIFLFFVVTMFLFTCFEGIFLAYQETPLALIKNLVQNFLRIGFLFVFIFWRSFGIFSANCLAAALALIFSFIFFVRKYPNFKIRLRIDFSILRNLLPFSLVNFFNAATLYLPGMIFPLIILSLFSEREVGLFYVPWMIFSVYCSFIASISSVFLMQAAHGEDVKALLRKTISFCFLLSILGFVLFYFWGEGILLLFKKDFFFHSFGILKVLFLSIFSFTINQIYLTLKNIKNEIFDFFSLSFIILISLIFFVIILLFKMGSLGMAYSWLFSQLIGNVYLLSKILIKKD
ncbi:MAG: oligosaccharide flippase family protein [Candidatus Omnitrophota bacterium]